MAATSAPTPQQLAAQNMLARQAVVGNSIKMTQQIFSQSVDPATQNVINVTGNSIRNVGLLLGFIVEVSGNIHSAAVGDLTRTNFGNANMVQQFRYDDLSNYTRIQVPGWYLALLNSVRQGFGFGGVYANNIPMGYGANYPVYDGESTVTAGAGDEAIRMMYYVPIAYSDTDLRGAIWMSTVSATSNLQITLNQTPVVSSAGNPLTAIYQGGAAIVGATWSGNVTVTVYQVYLDQVPRMQNGAPILPMQDLNVVYELKQTTFTTPTSGQDFPMAYSNFRSFLSTTAVFDNGGSFVAGTNVNYWSLASANFTNIWKVTPEIAALLSRQSIMTDFPSGTYFFESRNIPINTINYGNMELNLNATGSVSATARVLVGYEAFALVSQVVGASSLAGG